MKGLVDRLTQQEQLNFLLTNRIPRRWATLFVGWFSKIENPIISWISITLWKLFADDLKLHEAQKTRFNSLHDCFIRELKPGSRPIRDDPQVIISPCDAIVGAHGRIEGTEVFQAKGFPYSLEDLMPDGSLASIYRDGIFVTLRLKSNMYHRFHAPCDGSVDGLTYISGDTWNVNPIALRRIEKLYCKNERAVITIQSDAFESGASLTLVPVAAILVASMKFSFLDEPLDLRYRGPNVIPCDHQFRKGEELGYFQHGSTIIVFATKHFELSDQLSDGNDIRMGESLLVKC